MEYVEFGRTGLKVSRLSMGTGSNGWAHRSEQTDLGPEGLASLLRAAYDRGINFWDAADQYGSHAGVARALRGLSREAVVITTKTVARTAQGIAQDIERFRSELDTDVLDIVLLHCVTGQDWPKQCAEAMEALAHAKAAGQVRAVGISCHAIDALRTACETDWVEVVLARINHAGVNMDGTPSEVAPLLEQLYRAGKAVYSMKVLGCGQLTHDVYAAIRYVLQLGTVHALTIGMSHLEHLEHNLRAVEELAPQYPLLRPTQ